MTTTDDREAFLREVTVAVLATVGARGRPHAVPIWYLYEDGEIVMIAGPDSQKARNIARNPEVTLVVDRRTLPYYAVMVRGRAAIGPPPAKDLHLRIAVRYLGEELGRQYHDRRYGGGAVTLRLRPEKIIEYHGAAGRDRDEPG